MEARATTRYARLTAQKARLVVDLIRGRGVEDALGILQFTPKRGAKIIAKTLKSAIANAEHGTRVDVDQLYVKSAFVNEGPTGKRFLPRAHGRATPIFKRTSHITVVVDERRRGAEA
jgi:large subunit ribosomal protein L22